MAELYDTAKIREAARLTRRLSSLVDDEAVYELRRAEEAAEALRGLAAQALIERLSAQQKVLRSNAERLVNVAAKLQAYADSLEAADRKVAALFREGGDSA